MNYHMSLEIGTLRETLSTDIANKRLFSGVDTTVSYNVCRIGRTVRRCWTVSAEVIRKLGSWVTTTPNASPWTPHYHGLRKNITSVKTALYHHFNMSTLRQYILNQIGYSCWCSSEARFSIFLLLKYLPKKKRDTWRKQKSVITRPSKVARENFAVLYRQRLIFHEDAQRNTIV